VETVSEQCHRIEDGAGDDLADHHQRSESDDPQRAARIGIVIPAEEDVVVGEGIRIAVAHDDSYLA